MRARSVAMGMVLLVVLLWALRGDALAAERIAQLDPEPSSATRFGPIASFEFTDSQGRTVSDQDLLGAPWVAVPFFVRCSGPCPNITTDLRSRVYDALAKTNAKIVSFSIDPNFDNPKALADYAERFGIDTERWLFLTGDEGAMTRFVTAGLKVAVQRDGVAEPGLEPPITHGTRLVAVDGEGQIAGWYEGARENLGVADIAVEAGYTKLLSRLLHLSGPLLKERVHSPLPLLNAVLNGTAFVLLLVGWRAIRAGQRTAHIRCMGAALVVSAAFLVSYVTYHVGLQHEQGPTVYNGTGWAKTAYLVLLASHVILAMVNLPMVLRVFFLAYRERWEDHRRLARKTLPVWLYVSVTGVVVYLLLYPLNPTVS